MTSFVSSSSPLLVEDCRFCSVVSKNNGEDPIGSVQQHDQWLIIEMPQPWNRSLWFDHPVAQAVFSQIKDLRENHGIKTRPMVIAPDRDYSIPDHTRILYYRRPAQLFAQFEQQEFLVPTERVLEVAIALLQQSKSLSEFDAYRQASSTRDIMVCTHGNIDVACSRFGYPIYEQLRQEYAGETLRVWRCSHFGGHNFAPTLVDLPTGQYWGHVEPEILDTLIYRCSAVSGLRLFYRGWSGLKRFEQMVEREIWIQQGWNWLNYLKLGTTIAIDESQDDEWDADWAEVCINFRSLDGSISGTYHARVETYGTVVTQHRSGDETSIETVKQYRVVQLSLEQDGIPQQ